MYWKRIVLLLLIVSLGVGSVPALQAEQRKERVDLTERERVTPEEIITGLTPRQTPTFRTRGITGQTRGIAPGLATIAIMINFAFDSAKILPAAEPHLESLGKALQSERLAPYRIRIEGHTDSVGSAEYNQGLSYRRAESVKQYLVNHFGIPADRLEAVGRGENEPLSENHTRHGRWKNRRAEFVNVGQQ
jgi:outer membrane protein OmpA-like peptidoglycan-associated protein